MCFIFKQNTAYGIAAYRVGSGMSIRDSSRHLLGMLLPVVAHSSHLLGRRLAEVTVRVSALLGVSTLLGLVGLLILGRIGRAHNVLPCW